MNIDLVVNVRNFQQGKLSRANWPDPGLDDAKQFK